LLRFLGYTVFLPFRILYLTTEEQILKNSKKIIAVSNEVRDQILALYQIPVEKIVVIPNGVDLARFKPDAEKRARIRKELAIGNDDRVLIFIGHLFEIKGLDYVLDAIKLLPEMRLIVVGEGVNIHSYKQRIAMQGRDRQVCFLGTVLKHNEDYYSAADVFILPSESEGFPLAALEAAASGLPLITTRTGGLSDLVVPGENGFFIQRDAVEIRDVLLRLTKDSELMRRMGARSRERAQSYSWDETVRRIEMVYHQILTK
jgi:UDP-glucose:(heptosyl)LPS alpha-1,3-glucosyltransferase